jgi:hypothetical protein
MGSVAFTRSLRPSIDVLLFDADNKLIESEINDSDGDQYSIVLEDIKMVSSVRKIIIHAGRGRYECLFNTPSAIQGITSKPVQSVKLNAITEFSRNMSTIDELRCKVFARDLYIEQCSVCAMYRYTVRSAESL